MISYNENEIIIKNARKYCGKYYIIDNRQRR